jgi:hypothetical protein
MNESWLLWSMLFGSIGLGYFVYGKKQRLVAPLVCGLALMLYPWFVASTWWLVIIGAGLSMIPWFIRI